MNSYVKDAFLVTSFLVLININVYKILKIVVNFCFWKLIFCFAYSSEKNRDIYIQGVSELHVKVKQGIVLIVTVMKKK